MNEHLKLRAAADQGVGHPSRSQEFKALIDSGAALPLAHTSVYNMIDDHFKTKILPAGVHLKMADGSSMCSLSKSTLHLHNANFKFSHTFITRN